MMTVEADWLKFWLFRQPGGFRFGGGAALCLSFACSHADAELFQQLRLVMERQFALKIFLLGILSVRRSQWRK